MGLLEAARGWVCTPASQDALLPAKEAVSAKKRVFATQNCREVPAGLCLGCVLTPGAGCGHPPQGVWTPGPSSSLCWCSHVCPPGKPLLAQSLFSFPSEKRRSCGRGGTEQPSRLCWAQTSVPGSRGAFCCGPGGCSPQSQALGAPHRHRAPPGATIPPWHGDTGGSGWPLRANLGCRPCVWGVRQGSALSCCHSRRKSPEQWQISPCPAPGGVQSEWEAGQGARQSPHLLIML